MFIYVNLAFLLETTNPYCNLSNRGNEKSMNFSFIRKKRQWNWICKEIRFRFHGEVEEGVGSLKKTKFACSTWLRIEWLNLFSFHFLGCKLFRQQNKKKTPMPICRSVFIEPTMLLCARFVGNVPLVFCTEDGLKGLL